MSRPPSDPTPPVPPPVAGPDLAPVRAFRLGLTASELQAAVPWAYLWADADEPPPPLLANVTGELVRHLDRLEAQAPESAGAVGALRRAIDALLSAVCSRGSVHRCTWVECRERLTADGVHEQSGARVAAAVCSGWWSVHRSTWVECRERLTADGVHEQSGARVAAFADAPMRPAWDALRDATDAFSAALPHGLRVLFDLGRVVGEAGDASERYRQPGFDPSRWLYVTLAPRVEQLLADARRLHPCLAALPELPCGNAAGGEPPFDGMTKAIRALADRVPALLADAATSLAASADVTEHPLAAASPQVAEPAAVETVPAEAVEPPALRVPPLAVGESFPELLALKQRLDPDGTYVGQSLAILRLFQQIEDLNRLPNLPVTLLGPSRSGKTRLAEVIHRASSRKDKPFLHLNASELNGGDPNLFREKWMGFGKNSAVGNRKSSDFADGWLQTTDGGTIFVDELHSLDLQAVDYLRALLGRDLTKFRPPTGEQKTFLPDVRLVFATYRDIAELKDEGVLPEDFGRRLLDRYLTVPSLNDRREDIPLFVDRYREGRRLDERFLLALLQHDWRSLEVDGLLTAIQTAVSRTPATGSLEVESLQGTSVSADVLARVSTLDERAAGRELYGFLINLLRHKGFEPGTRGRSLNVRLAELMGVDRSTIDRRMRKLGLVPSGGGE